MTNYIQQILNNKRLAMCLFIDFSKAFDRVSHKTLMKKLLDTGFGQNDLIFVRDYFAHRYCKTAKQVAKK